jgi:diguanylate cyclase (GGDEF)-like protein
MGDLGEVTVAVKSIRDWATWQLPRPAQILVLTVIGAYLCAIGAGGWQLITLARSGNGPLAADLMIAATFALASVISAEVSMRLAWPRARRDRISRDLLSVWWLPIALLLPPIYVMVAIVPPCLYLQLRVWRRGQPIKRVYSTAALGLAYGGASYVQRAVLDAPAMAHWTATQFTGGTRVVVALAAGVATWWIVNAALISAVVLITAGKQSVSAFLKDREGIATDLIAGCVGIAAAVLWVTNPVFAALLIPPVLLLQHQLFSGLRQAVRTDLLTDVANPQFWREVAGREVDRAAASGAPLAILMIDVDHFKGVNDRHGHLAGDDVLAAVARTVAQSLRPGDLVGRLGGEEFGAVLNGLNLLDAEGAAERLRSQVEDLQVRADSGKWIKVTVSVGVSELSVTGGDLHRLLDAADTALYAAKAAGRNCVRVAGPRQGQVIDLTAGERVIAPDSSA